MADTDDPAPPALQPGELADLRNAARGELRHWLPLDEGSLLRRIDVFGAAELSTAATLAGRLGVTDDVAEATAALDALGDLVTGIHAPVPRRSLFGTAPVPAIEVRLARAEPELNRLLERLTHVRDELARGAMKAETLAARTAQADGALERVVRLAPLLATGLESAARELKLDQPDRARFLCGEAAARVVERQRDLSTQLVILRQARLSHDLLAVNESSLVRAIDRARITTVTALRTAVRAAQAIDGAAQAGARVAQMDAAAARREIEGAVAEMRDALAP